ncbi:VWA domain-containing protein [Pelagivirga sediminicola]|uniref:VWA domain-containing protein n=1 Tax=Pelagivirga sediminicola TaxID=2170575 RepID=A0A2T7GB94_9RHOB|nr:VWA domain-containing protein [Pelagivirga sediminicola]PVA11700.1 VWA domain-containing protein [Pelagivirga sediminicola]
MHEYPDLDLPDDPKLAQNIAHFIRALRRAGLPVGPGRVIDAVRAVADVGFTSKRDFYWTLHALCVTRPEHRAVFAQIFRLYWRDPRFLEHMMGMLLPTMRGLNESPAAKPAEKRAAEALLDGAQAPMPQLPDTKDEDSLLEIDASATASARERLRSLDFEQMGTDEIAQAKRMLSRLTLPVPPMLSRRMTPDARGRLIDARATMRLAMRRDGEITQLARRTHKPRAPDLVVLCDISGSMSQYSRMVLHFVHAVANSRGADRRGGWGRVHAFTFGTRLSNITRHLDTRDVDAALAAAGREVQDWEGGTRIGDCLEAFNRDWSRRVLGQGAVVLLITDGLDRGAPAHLAAQIERLHLTARRLIWLNPLLRWDGFAPKAQGIAAMLPHVDALMACHSVASIEDLAAAFAAPLNPAEKTRLMAAR